MREWWEINLVTICPTHHASLVATCRCGTALSWTDKFLDRCDHCEVSNEPADVQVSDSTEFERWLAGRLDLVSERPTSRWLDELKLGQSIRLIENVGLLVDHGFSQAMPAQIGDPATRNSVMAIGFETIQGPAFEEVIRRSVDEFQRSTGTRLPKRPFEALGWFGDWFGDEGFANDLPINVRLAAALETALGCDVGDSYQTGVMDISVLADRLQQPIDAVLDTMRSKIGERPPRGLFVSTAVALDLLRGNGHGYRQNGSDDGEHSDL